MCIRIVAGGPHHPETLLRIVCTILDQWIDHWYAALRKEIFIPVRVQVTKMMEGSEQMEQVITEETVEIPLKVTRKPSERQ